MGTLNSWPPLQSYLCHTRSESRILATVPYAFHAGNDPSRRDRAVVRRELSHSDADIQRTAEAAHEALAIYRKALDEGVQKYLKGRPVKPVGRRFN